MERRLVRSAWLAAVEPVHQGAGVRARTQGRPAAQPGRSGLGPLSGTASGLEAAFGTGNEASSVVSTAANFAGGFSHGLSTNLLVGKAYQGHQKKDEQDAVKVNVPIDIGFADKPITAEALSFEHVSMLLDKGCVPGALELKWASKERMGTVTCDLTGTEPYYFEERRKQGFAQRTCFVWKKVAAGAPDAFESASEPSIRRS